MKHRTLLITFLILLLAGSAMAGNPKARNIDADDSAFTNLSGDSVQDVLGAADTLWGGFSTGSDGQVLYKNGSVLGSAGNIYYDDSTGYIGLGTAGPAEALHVAGNIALSGTINSVDISSLPDGNGTGSYIPLWLDSNTLTNSSLYNSGSGNVGIGSTAPAAKLDVAGTVILRGAPGLSGLAVTSSGYVGIGTAYPESELEVSGTAQADLFSGPLTGNVTGNASTATALASNGDNCPAGSYPLGVDASGAAEGCTDATTEIDSAISTHTGNASAHHAPVTVSGTPDYVSLAGQELTLNKLDLTDDLNAFSSAGLSGNLTDEVGSGYAVFNGSPHFTGQVGIGTTDPDATLQVAGTVSFRPNGVQGFYQSSNGNAGVGTTNPPELFTVSGTVKAQRYLGDGSELTGVSVSPAGSDGDIQYNNGGSFGGASALYYDDVNDRLGIGTASPTAALEVSGNGKFSWLTATGLQNAENTSYAQFAISEPSDSVELDYAEYSSDDLAQVAYFAETGTFRLFLQEHNSYSGAPDVAFSEPTAGTVKTYQTSDQSCYGITYVQFPRDWLHGKKASVTWSTVGNNASYPWFYFWTIDGYYTRGTSDFINGTGSPWTKGSGKLQEMEKAVGDTSSHTTTVTLDLSSGTQTYAAVAVWMLDAWGHGYINNQQMTNLQILDTDDTVLWSYDSSGNITMEQTGTISDYGYYGTTSGDLMSYTESSIKTQGSYSIKGVANTSALDKTLTHYMETNADLSGKMVVSVDIRASRTGSNIKIGIHDSGGTTTEFTPEITTADTFQTVQMDISGVSDADKDDIDQIIITIVNADSANTFYLDNIYGAETTIYRDFTVSTSGSERFRVDRNGNVGIGMTDPADPLQVGGALPSVTIGDADEEDIALNFTGAAQTYYVGLDDADDVLKIGSGDTVGVSSVVNITASGKVGIGTAVPVADLDVNNVFRIKPVSSATCDSNCVGCMYVDSDDNHFYGCNGTSWGQLDN